MNWNKVSVFATAWRLDSQPGAFEVWETEETLQSCGEFPEGKMRQQHFLAISPLPLGHKASIFAPVTASALSLSTSLQTPSNGSECRLELSTPWSKNISFLLLSWFCQVLLKGKERGLTQSQRQHRVKSTIYIKGCPKALPIRTH